MKLKSFGTLQCCTYSYMYLTRLVLLAEEKILLYSRLFHLPQAQNGILKGNQNFRISKLLSSPRKLDPQPLLWRHVASAVS